MRSDGVNEVQRVSAGMLGRGKSQNAVAKFAGVTTRTIQNWIRDVDGFAEEVKRVRASSKRPEPRGVLLDALSARRDDGVDWTARVRAAEKLLSLADAEPEAEQAQIIVYAPLGQ
jgi:transposase